MQDVSRTPPVLNWKKLNTIRPWRCETIARTHGVTFAALLRRMGDPDRRQWYVLRTKPRAEESATCHLERKQIGVFFPRLAMPQPRGLRVGLARDRIEPLFPGYLFVHLDLPSDYYSAAWTPGIRDFLKLGDAEPQVVEDDVVACLRSRADGDDVVRPRPRFRIGDRVEVRAWPVRGSPRGHRSTVHGLGPDSRSLGSATTADRVGATRVRGCPRLRAPSSSDRSRIEVGDRRPEDRRTNSFDKMGGAMFLKHEERDAPCASSCR